MATLRAHRPFLTVLARSEPVVIAVALGQSAALVGLVIAWLVVLLGPELERWRSRRARQPRQPVSQTQRT